MDIGLELAQLRKKLEALERASRLSHASLEDTALQVYDGEGSLRAILGVQSDGTTAVNVVNGPPPPAPSAPVVASVLGGVTAGWDGTFADGSPVPLDWARTEVHASTAATFTPDASTLRTTIETAQGGTVVLSTDTPVYVLLVARNTSGAASAPSAIVGPYGPEPVVAQDVLDGIVTTVKLADDAVTQAKVATGAIGSTEISDNAVTTPKIVAGAVQTAQLDAAAVNASKIASGAVTTDKLDALAVTADKVAANAITAGKIAAGAVTATSLTVGVGQSIAQKITDAMGDATLWAQTFDSGTPTWLTGVTDAAAGGTVVQAAGPVTLERVTNTPYDPDALYKVTVRVRTTVAPTAGSSTIYMGLVGVAADGTTRVSSTGANNFVTGQHFIAANNVTVAVGTAWSTFTGYVKGTAATGTTAACPDPKAPGQVNANVRYVRPIVRLLMGATGGTMQVDQVTLETVSTGVVSNVNIADGAITANKIQAGAVDATAIAADAITGKTITGGTITGTTVTGGLIQTASSGERITLNESNQNKVIVYNSSGTAINELSSRGLLVKGTTGAVLWLNPNATYPQLKLNNASGTNSAVVQAGEPVTGDANIEIASGTFSGNGYSDMAWRTVLARDAISMDRLRWGTPNTRIGGRIALSPTYSLIGFQNTDDTTQTSGLTLEANYAHLDTARLHVLPPASSNSALRVDGATGHTGNLLRATLNGTDKFTVDPSGNTAVSGNLTVSGRVQPASGETGTLSLQSGWTNFDSVNYGTAQVRKTADGMAYLTGRLSAGTITSGTLVATLPSTAYYPLVRHAFPHRAAQGGVDVTLLVNELGELRIYDISGTPSNLALSGMFWPLF